MTANRQNENRFIKQMDAMICIFYGILLLWMLEVGTVNIFTSIPDIRFL
ncbi:MAG: hypothetical protein ACLUVA_09300 [Faecalibacterium sp.]